jgi:hypothetical protein
MVVIPSLTFVDKMLLGVLMFSLLCSARYLSVPSLYETFQITVEILDQGLDKFISKQNI